MSPSILPSFVAVLLAPSLVMADVLLVGPPGSGLAHTTIQSAVDAAAPGDTILVRSGSYGGFVLNGKGVSIAPDVRGAVEIQGTVEIRQVPAGQIALLSHLRVLGLVEEPALIITGCDGFVRLQESFFIGGEGKLISTTGTPGSAGVLVEQSPAVAFVLSRIYGGWGGGVACCGIFQGGQGGDGLVSLDSSVALYGCELRGGAGGAADLDPGCFAGHGGDACSIDGWGVFASGTLFRGGTGGWAFHGGNGGDGLFVGDNAQAQLVDVGLEAGDPCCGGIAGEPSSGGGIFVHHPQPSRTLSAHQLAPATPTALAAAGASIPVIVRGAPGDQVHLMRSSAASHQWEAPLGGLWLLDTSLADTFQGEIGPTGELWFDLTPAVPPAGTPTAIEYVQALVHSPGGESVLTNSLHRIVLDCGALTPDCDGDGTYDTCQILADPTLDLNADSMLDSCLPPITWHVDPAAAGGGNGTAGAPFATILEAVGAAAAGDIVQLADGVYTGAGNKSIILDKRVTVRSGNGPSACVIDLENSGWAFRNGIFAKEIRLEGLTIQRSSMSSNFSGHDLALSIENCVFQDNRSSAYGGALHFASGHYRVQGSTFLRNEAYGWSSGRGGALAGGDVELIDCRFEQNRAGAGGGAVDLHTVPGRSTRIASCIFVDNSAVLHGGAIRHTGSGMLLVDNSLLVGNTSVRGGALSSSQGSQVILSSSTLVENAAAFGAALHLVDDCRIRVFNSILWPSQASSGNVAHLAGSTAFLEIAYSTLPRNPVPVRASPGATLVWGAGIVALDPQFVAAGDWQLSATSPCIDAGNNTLLTQDVHDANGNGLYAEPMPFDLAGAPRRVDIPGVPSTGVGPGPIVDHGAYERQR